MRKSAFIIYVHRGWLLRARPDRNLAEDGDGGERKQNIAPAADIALGPSAGAAEAFQMILKDILRQMAAGQESLQSPNPDALHDVRVALRRLRSAIKLFPDMLTVEQTKAILAELKWIGGRLSFARDVDVFIADVVLPLTTKYPGDVRIRSLYRKCLSRQKAEYRRIQTVLNSKRFRAFGVSLTEAAEGSNVSGSDLDRPARVVAADSLARMKRKIENGKRLKDLGRRDLHRFRLQVKAMRYALEFVRGLVTGERQCRRFDRMLTSLQRMQSALGEITDIRARRKTCERIAGRSVFSGQSIKHRFAGLKLENTRRQRKCLSQAIDAYDRFLKTKPCWRWLAD